MTGEFTLKENPKRTPRKNGHIFKHGRCYWIKYSRHGRPYRENSHSDKESDARRLLNKRLGEIAVGRFVNPAADKVTVRKLAADYIADYRANGLKSLDKAERVTRDSFPLMKFFGDCRAHSVGADMVKKYVALRLEEQVKNATINRELAALKRMFSLGIQAEKIYHRPHIAMLKENNVRKGFFEHAEFIVVRDSSPDYFKPVVTFAYYTGWRKKKFFRFAGTKLICKPKKSGSMLARQKTTMGGSSCLTASY